ncbi:hypothetical protein K1T71_014496 [Dendrolimus kikuchii]|uniref:Uncharacterized protein n=1 Tax=Dendrolimus kikuchii TaxID=765133 RepID=A0ACC1CE64_9NEOP|nr:hypothetical protein K1T71_014496 [Dendrolimus kikuchii]
MLFKITLCSIVILATSTTLAVCEEILTTKRCRKDQWQCRDSTCIPFDDKCDGKIDCSDSSDETHALCRNLECQSNWFRCTYGACVDGTAPCNGTKECADNSDELLPRCRHATMTSSVPFRCDDGTEIPYHERCDGKVNCQDTSDELLKTCADMSCLPYYFQCAYGACVDHGAECNGVKDCYDNSDESDELCNRLSATTTPVAVKTSNRAPVSNTDASTSTTTLSVIISTSTPASTSTKTEVTVENKSGMCKLPPYPKHGKYVFVNHVANVTDNTEIKPGMEYKSFYLNITCNEGYGVIGNKELICFNGEFFKQKTVPKCIKFCKIQRGDGMTYRCSRKGRRGACEDFEPPGTIAEIDCSKPVYYLPIGSATQLTCLQDGSWDNQAICSVECGKVASSAKQLMIGGRITKHGDFPWHAAIYRRDNKKGLIIKNQICGGTLISRDVVVSAAHCFWDDVKGEQEDSSKYAVGLGKIYRRWDDPNDDSAEYFDLICLRIPEHYDGSAGNFQSDIAVLKLNALVVYNTYIRPICFDHNNVVDIKMDVGRVAGWGLTSQEGHSSRILQYVKLPYVKLSQCKKIVPDDFRGNLAYDKFCAGDTNGTALCQGDSGGGLVFPDSTSGDRYFLRGIVSTAPVDNNMCNKFTITTFTDVAKHLNFINNFHCDT